MFKCSTLYEANLNATEDLIINQGGTSSGKTYSLMQMLFTLAIIEKNRSILVVGQSVPNLKVGAITDAQNIVDSSPELQTTIKSYNKTDRLYEFHSGSTMQFKSFNDFQDAKSGKRDYTFFNEINGIPKPIFDEIHLPSNTVTTILTPPPNFIPIIWCVKIAHTRTYIFHNLFLFKDTILYRKPHAFYCLVYSVLHI